MKVHIKNFQSIEDGEIEIDGLTVLVGPNNIGKSAVIRSIKGAIKNKSGDGFVTDGKDNTEVTIDCPDEDLELTWKKGKDYNDYEVNGEELKKVGYGAPPHVAEHGFREIEAGKDSINVQFADQFNPLFLLNETGSTSAEAISDVGRLTDVQDALRNCEKDLRSVKSERKVRKSDLEDVRSELEDYNEYEDDMKQIEELKEYYSDISKLRENISQLKSKRNKSESLRKKIEDLEPIVSVTIPECRTEGLVKEINKLVRMNKRRDKIKERVDKYSGVESLEIPSLEEDSLYDEIKDLREKCSQLRDLSKKIPETKNEIENLQDDIEKTHQEFHNVLEDAGQCPTCEREVT